jgi:hypothetical protein
MKTADIKYSTKWFESPSEKAKKVAKKMTVILLLAIYLRKR